IRERSRRLPANASRTYKPSGRPAEQAAGKFELVLVAEPSSLAVKRFELVRDAGPRAARPLSSPFGEAWLLRRHHGPANIERLPRQPQRLLERRARRQSLGSARRFLVRRHPTLEAARIHYHVPHFLGGSIDVD